MSRRTSSPPAPPRADWRSKLPCRSSRIFHKSKQQLCVLGGAIGKAKDTYSSKFVSRNMQSRDRANGFLTTRPIPILELCSSACRFSVYYKKKFFIFMSSSLVPVSSFDCLIVLKQTFDFPDQHDRKKSLV